MCIYRYNELSVIRVRLELLFRTVVLILLGYGGLLEARGSHNLRHKLPDALHGVGLGVDTATTKPKQVPCVTFSVSYLMWPL